MTMDPQKIVEENLTETIHRHIYFGYEVHKDLAIIQDFIDPANQLALDYVQAWMLTLDLSEIYRKSVIQNNLIDLHHLIVSYVPTPQTNNISGEALTT